MENEDEEEEMDPDGTMSEGDVEAQVEMANLSAQGSRADDGEVELYRRRVLRHDGEHGGANEQDEPSDELEHGADETEDEPFEEEEESPSQRYQRYQQSLMEVSGPDESCNIHDGFGTVDSEMASSSGVEVPTPKAMPQPLAKQAAGNRAMEKAVETRDE